MKALALLFVLLTSCTPTLRQQSINIGNAAAHVSDAQTNTVIAHYCGEQMHALGHPSEYAAGHCTRSDSSSVPASSASPEQAAALASVRARWALVLEVNERVVRAQNALAGLLNAGAAASDGDILAAIMALGSAYADLRAATATVGYTLPNLLGN